jgi:hypothetical protein
MKDFNLHKFLRDNPLTKQKNPLKKGKINEAFDGFGGYRDISPIHESPFQSTDSSFDPTDTANYGEMDQPNKWIADIDRVQPEYGDWKATWEHPGIIVWSHADVPDAVVVATPGWDGQGTPVEFQSNAGSSQMLKVLDQDEFVSFKEYLNAIKPYLDMVLDANVNPTGNVFMKKGVRAPSADEFQGVHEGGYMGTQYDSSEDMAVDMVKTGVREGSSMKTLFVMDYQSGKMFSKMVDANMQSEEIEEMLTDEYGMNPSDVYYMITDEAEIENLDDANLMENDYFDRRKSDMAKVNKTITNFISGDDEEDEMLMPNRIDGMVNQRELQAFAEAALNIAQDLDDEGFDAQDIKKFLINKLNDMIM